MPFQYSISCCECPKHICIKSHIEASRTMRLRPEKQGVTPCTGGIISAAVDGMKAAEAVAQKIIQCRLG